MLPCVQRPRWLDPELDCACGARIDRTRHCQKSAQREPILQASIKSCNGHLELSPWGKPTTFENEYFEGTVFFAHRPPPGSSIPFDFGVLLAGRGDPEPLWELQIQGRFKVKPSNKMFFGMELWDGPMQLGIFARSCCSIILKLGHIMAKQRGVEFRHSFGNEYGEKPTIAFPLCGADRVFLSDSPLPLPIQGDSSKGVWKMQNGSLTAIDRSSLALDTESYFTFLFATSYLDWSTWTLSRIPGLGCLDLEQFWGSQSAHIVLYDEDCGCQRLFYSMELKTSHDNRQSKETAEAAHFLRPVVEELVGLMAKSSGRFSQHAPAVLPGAAIAVALAFCAVIAGWGVSLF
mmetsp:Transcript_74553/g.132164  ORF Transcript_74553/g.132164 Transcript_74553/m.132164 type:complete len:347 (+) Transcript_74553:64-1104(+)